jgi:methionyl-tRNA formyltransferase
MEKILILYTGVAHQVYLVNQLQAWGFPICGIVCEDPIPHPSFDTSFPYIDERTAFEKNALFGHISSEISKIPVYQVDDINSQFSVKIINKLNPDIGIVFGTKKLKPEVIDSFDNFILNIHRGFAAEYRGLNSDFWAIYHRDIDNIGVTIHRVDRELDTGPYTFMERMPIERNTKIWQLRGLTTMFSAKLLRNTLELYSNKNLTFHTQKKRGRYYSFFPTIFIERSATYFHKYTSRL